MVVILWFLIFFCVGFDVAFFFFLVVCFCPMGPAVFGRYGAHLLTSRLFSLFLFFLYLYFLSFSFFFCIFILFLSSVPVVSSPGLQTYLVGMGPEPDTGFAMYVQFRCVLAMSVVSVSMVCLF